MTKLYDFQKEGIEQIEKFNGRVLLADAMGLGKTIQALTYLKRHKEIRPAIIVCPASLKWVWEGQARQHCGLRTTVLSGRKQPKNTLKRNHPIIILNYDILDAWKDYLISLKPQIVIGDEIHAIKSPNAKRTKAFRELCRNVPHIIAISGTPLTNRPSELFPTLNILWKKEFPTFMAFGHRYCGVKKVFWGCGWDFRGASNLPELHGRLKRLGMIRRLKEDVLKDLPDKMRIVVPMDIEDRSEYTKALNDFIGWLSSKSAAKAKRASKAEELVKIGYLVRLASQLKMKSVFEWIDNFFEESDGKLVLFACHRNIIDEIHKRYPKISVVITGSTSMRKRKLVVQKFQRNPKTRLFIGNIRAAGVGIDLWAANTVAFVEFGFVPGECVQAEDRTHRIGQTQNVSCYYLCARDTIDESLCKILQNKQRIITETLDGSKRRKEKLDVYNQLLKTIKIKE